MPTARARTASAVVGAAVKYVALAAALVLNAPAHAEGTATPPPASTAPAASAPAERNDGNELVCKRVREVGSHIARRVCRTRAEVDAARAGANSAFERIYENPASTGGGESPSMPGN